MDIVNIDYKGNDLILNKVEPTDMQGRLKARDKIEKLEKFIIDLNKGSNEEKANINKNLKEHFIGGAYIRELTIPKDRMMVSNIWSKDRFWIIVYGEVTFTTEMGSQRIKAPFTMKAELGSKVAFYTHTDVLWFAITGSKATNSIDVEKDVTVDNYSQCNYQFLEGK